MSTTKTVELTNGFHHTSVRVRVRDGWLLSASQRRRATRELCGMSDCCCGHFVFGPQSDAAESYLQSVANLW